MLALNMLLTTDMFTFVGVTDISTNRVVSYYMFMTDIFEGRMFFFFRKASGQFVASFVETKWDIIDQKSGLLDVCGD